MLPLLSLLPLLVMTMIKIKMTSHTQMQTRKRYLLQKNMRDLVGQIHKIKLNQHFACLIASLSENWFFVGVCDPTMKSWDEWKHRGYDGRLSLLWLIRHIWPCAGNLRSLAS
jgi:hypothetical protein